MRAFRNFLDKYAQGRTVLTLFIATHLVYALMLLITIPTLHEFSGGLTIPDMMPTGYDHNYLQRLMAALGEEGRHYYLARQLPADLVYPFLFGLTYSLLTAWVFKRFGAFTNVASSLALLPVVAALADYAENLGLMAVLRAYPDNSEKLSQFTSASSQLKSLSTTIFFAFFLLGLAYLFLTGGRRSKTTKKVGPRAD